MYKKKNNISSERRDILHQCDKTIKRQLIGIRPNV